MAIVNLGELTERFSVEEQKKIIKSNEMIYGLIAFLFDLVNVRFVSLNLENIFM